MSTKLRTKPVKAVKTITRGMGMSMPDFEDVKIPPHVGGKCIHERSQSKFVAAMHEPTFAKDPKTGKRYVKEFYAVKADTRWGGGRRVPQIIHDKKNFTDKEVYVEVAHGDYYLSRRYQGDTHYSAEAKAYDTVEQARKFIRGQLRKKKSVMSVAKANGYKPVILQIDLWYELHRQFHITDEIATR
jgi:hypothetical protein